MTTAERTPNSFRNQPDERGHFGQFGGRYVAETLMPLVLDLEREYRAAQQDPAFAAQFDDLLEHYVGRPSPLYYAERLTEEVRKDAPAGKGAQIWFKRDELNHTGAHKINNCVGQILLAIRMGKTRIIAETGAGQHGVATATVCARFGLPCFIYMGAKDIERQQPNVFRMRLLGAEIIPVTSGAGTIRNTGGALTLSGALSKNGTTLTLAGGSNGITVSGTISGSNANSDLIIDGGTTTLTNANNSYNGPTFIINGATLNANTGGALPNHHAQRRHNQRQLHARPRCQSIRCLPQRHKRLHSKPERQHTHHQRKRNHHLQRRHFRHRQPREKRQWHPNPRRSDNIQRHHHGQQRHP
jgi:hypothetical protein